MRYALGLSAAFVVVLVRLQTVESNSEIAVKARERLSDSMVRVLVLGDSVAAGSGDESGRGIAGRLGEQLGRDSFEVINRGIPGARVRDVRRAIAERSDEVRRSDVIILSIGGNDLYGSSLERSLALLCPDYRMRLVARRVQRLVQTVQQMNPAARIILLGLYNPYWRTELGPLLSEFVHRWDGSLMARFAGNQQVSVLPVADLLEAPERLSSRDRFHPGVDGYTAIASRIAGGSIFLTAAARD